MLRNFLIACICLSPLATVAQAVDSFKVFFPLNERGLMPSEQDKIDSLIGKHLVKHNQKLSILGYADYLAGEEYNLKLSQDRAENVKSYLVQAGFKAGNIKLCIGKGKIERNPVNGKLGYPDDRKVVITIDKIVVKTKPVPSTPKSPRPPCPPPPIPKPAQAPKQLDIATLQVNETLVLKNILFLPGRHTIRAQSLPELENLLNILKAHPTLKIRIEGHICCVSSEADGFDFDNNTWQLSKYRAKTVYDYLVSNDIDPERLQYKGFAKTHPLIDPERNEDDQDQNRRVEIRILEK